MLINDRIIEKINGSINAVLENNRLSNDLGNNLKAIITSILRKLDVVTREEFDVQQQVLLATRAKLEELEKKINELVR